MKRHTISINDSIAYHIHRTARLLRAHLLRRIRDLGLSTTPEQWFVLNKLQERNGQSQSELSDEIFSDRPNITRIIEGMEKQGWVTRRVDEADQRKRLVYLTDAGTAVADAIGAMARVERAVIFSGLNDSDLAATRRLLERLERNVSQQLE